jgi:hypothetical protein
LERSLNRLASVVAWSEARVLGASTLESWVGIPLEAWMCFGVALLCVGRCSAKDKQPHPRPNVDGGWKIWQKNSPEKAKTRSYL